MWGTPYGSRRISTFAAPYSRVHEVNSRASLFMEAAPFSASHATIALMDRFPVGLNTYCLRAFRWHDQQLMDYTAALNLAAIFPQDSLDPGTADPGHWRFVKEYAAKLGLHLETGTGGSLPRTPDRFNDSVKLLRDAVKRAAAMGSPIVR